MGLFQAGRAEGERMGSHPSNYSVLSLFLVIAKDFLGSLLSFYCENGFVFSEVK